MWNFNKEPKSSIDRDKPPAKGLRLFFQTLWREILSLVALNFLFYLFCIPVITIPAAYCAMTRLTVTMVRDQPHFLWTDFLKAFRTEFKKATLAGFTVVFGLAALVIATLYYWDFSRSNDFYLLPTAIAASGAMLLVFVSFSLFPMISLIDLPLKAHWRNACALVPLSFFHYLLAFVICAALVVAAHLLIPMSFLPAFLLYPSVLNFITVFSAYGGIKKHVMMEEES